MKNGIKSKEFIKKISTFLMLVFVFLFFTFATENFFAAKNMINILRQVSILGILTAGMTFVIISGGMDLSVGSQLGLTGVLCAMFLSQFRMGNVPSVILAVGIAACFGLLTGLLIVSLNVGNCDYFGNADSGSGLCLHIFRRNPHLRYSGTSGVSGTGLCGTDSGSGYHYADHCADYGIYPS